MHISPYCRQALVPLNFIKFGIRGRLVNVIPCVKFLVNRFRGYSVLTPPKMPFPIDLLYCPYNSVRTAVQHFENNSQFFPWHPIHKKMQRTSLRETAHPPPVMRRVSYAPGANPLKFPFGCIRKVYPLMCVMKKCTSIVFIWLASSPRIAICIPLLNVYVSINLSHDKQTKKYKIHISCKYQQIHGQWLLNIDIKHNHRCFKLMLNRPIFPRSPLAQTISQSINHEILMCPFL